MKSIVITALLAVLLVAGSASAQNEFNLIGPNHYSVVNPTDLTPWGADWAGTPPPTALNGGDEVAYGMDNGTQELWIKRLVLRITYDDRSGTGGLEMTGHGQDWLPKGKEGQEILITEEPTGTDGVVTLVITILYDPQPEWEWVKVGATGQGVDILEVVMITTCTPKMRGTELPSLTQWGMIALVLLILAAGAMVIRQRRRTMART